MSRLSALIALPPIALGIAAAAWMIASAPGPKQVEETAAAVPVRISVISAQDIRPTETAWGNLRAADTWIAVAEVHGEVIWRHPDLEPGRLIPAGTEVLRIDPADYELALAQSGADLAALGSEIAQLATERTNTTRILELERERLALTETDLARIRTLSEQGTVPQARADEAERATLLARRTVAELENVLALISPREARINAQIARTQAALARARRSLDHTSLRTPFDLRVTEVNAERFQTVASGQVLIRGDSIATAEVVAHLPLDSFRRLVGELAQDFSLADMMRDVPATEIEVTLSPLSDPAQVWPARVSRIEGALDARARTVPVVVTVDAPYAGAAPPQRMPLVPNMQVGMTFSGAALKGAISIPESALHAGTVRVMGTDDRLELRPVTAAFAQDGRVIITEGLAPGDRVILDDIAPAIPGLGLVAVEASE